MKISSTLLSRLIGSAFVCSITFHAAFAQPGNTAVADKSKFEWADEGIYREQMKKEGIPAAVIDKLVEQRKEMMAHGRKFPAVQQPVKLAGQNPITMAACSGMGGESGWGAWVASPANYSGGVVTPTSSGPPTAPRFNLTSGAGTDPCTPGPAFGAPTIPVVAPGFGNASIQIGQPQTNGSSGGCSGGCAEQLTYPLTVTPQDTNFTFSYAIVMEDPGHGATDQPFVSLCIYDSAGNQLPCGCFKYTSGPSIPGFYTSACNINSISYYKPWTLVGINLGPYIGQTLTVVITNADCGLSGHFAHSYWDFSCGTLSTVSQYCLSDTAVVLHAPLGAGMTYSWTPTGQTTDSIIVNPNLYDTVIAYVIPPSGCGYYQVYALFPTIVNTGFTYTVSCNTVQFTDTTTITGGTISGWQWSFPGGSPSSHTGQTPPTITYPVSGGTFNVTLTVTSQAGCVDSSVIVPITILPPPVANAGPNVSTCAANTQLCGTGGGTYLWMPGGQVTPCITVSPASPTTYTLTVTDANGCTSTDQVTVTLAQPPVLTVGPGDTICLGQTTATLNTTVPPGCTISWTPTTGLSCTNCPNPVANPGFSLTYTVIITDANGCTDVGTIPVTVGNIPFVSAIGSTTICPGYPATLNANTSNGQGPYTYSWSPPNNLSNPNSQTPIATPVTTTPYTVIVVDANGCTDDTSTIIYVGTEPSAAMAIWNPSLSCDGYAIPFGTNGSSNAVSYYWDFGDGTSSTLQNPIHSYPFNGSYVITLVVYNPPCRDSVDSTIAIADIANLIDLKPANVFTPNGDGMNDCFHPAVNVLNVPVFMSADSLKTTLGECIEMEVYDRWGIKMFATTDTEKCWNGKTLGGHDAHEGTYYYIVKFGEIELRGYVTLLRKTN